jgi:dTDP-4-amino-4,6-dideoxygalactose transaminase
VDGDRDDFQKYLAQHDIPSMIYYPVPLHLQKAYRREGIGEGSFPVAEKLSGSVISLPIHTEMTEDQLSYICTTINKYFNG